MLKRIHLRNIGPAADLEMEPGRGTSLVTGINGLGRTLVLDAAWRALTGRWPLEASPEIGTGHPGLPTAGAAMAAIDATEAGARGETRWHGARRRAEEHAWRGPAQRTDRTLLYAHGNGTVSTWIGTGRDNCHGQRSALVDGIVVSRSGNGTEIETRSISLERTLAMWGRNEGTERMLRAAMRCIVPEAGVEGADAMAVAEAVARGDAAGGATMRLTGVACMLAWAVLESAPWSVARGVTMLFDDVELHLHPARQREVLDGLRSLADEVVKGPVQLIATTNAPLVLASSEPWFDADDDRLFTLEADHEGRSIAREHAYAKQGTAGNWLTSDALGLPSDRSLAAEAAIAEAKRVSLKGQPERDEVRAADDALRAALPDEDSFWARWRYFAEQQLDSATSDKRQTPEK